MDKLIYILSLLIAVGCTSHSSQRDATSAASALAEAEKHRQEHILYADTSALDHAINYFESRGEDAQAADAHFYRGLSAFMTGDCNRTVTEALSALDMSAPGTLTSARAHELLADAYRQVYNLKVARLHRRAAANDYLRSGKKDNAFYAFMDLAGEYSHEENDSSHIIMSNAGKLLAAGDTASRMHYLLTYSDICRVREEYPRALDMIRSIPSGWRTQLLTADDSVRIGEVYYHCGMPDSAMIWFDHEEAGASIQYWKCIADLKERQGDAAAALAARKNLESLGYDRAGTTLSNTLEYEEKTFYAAKAERERVLRLRLTAVVVGLVAALVVLLLIILLWRLYRRSKSLRAQNEIKDVALMQTDVASLQSEEALAQPEQTPVHEPSESTVPDAVAASRTEDAEEEKWINVIIDFYMKRLNEISREYFKVNDEVRQKEIEMEFSRELRSLRSGDIFAEIERHLNEKNDGVVEKIRQQFPRFSEQQIRLLECSLAGLSSQSTCLLLSIEKGNYYVMWTRIRAKIRAADVPDRPLFHRLFLKPQ